jgi:hypothetical protein
MALSLGPDAQRHKVALAAAANPHSFATQISPIWRLSLPNRPFIQGDIAVLDWSIGPMVS